MPHLSMSGDRNPDRNVPARARPSHLLLRRLARAGSALVAIAVVVIASLLSATGAHAQQSMAYKQAIATAAADDPALAKFYQERGYVGIWTTNRDGRRRAALLEAFARAGDHALPTGKFDPARMRQEFARARTARERGELEVRVSRLFLEYVQDIQSGIVDPRSLGKDMALVPPRRDRLKTLEAFSRSTPAAFIRRLPPQTPGYANLLKEKKRLELAIRRGGWGEKVKARKLEPGDKGGAVVALRNRLIRMGYLRRTSSRSYDAELQKAVQRFQADHGLFSDGIAGKSTLEAINVGPEYRLQQVVVGLERQRWLNKPLGKRHVLVNQADFMAWIYDDGKPTFETRVVVGQAKRDFQTAEFSDEMTHMIVNPSWHVPESIMVREYLPKLRNNAAALDREGIIMSDSSGRPVDPSQIDLSQYGADNWPFSMRQPPGQGNALGRVKFMFPNKFNIYMHDTPARSLFGREARAYSHGCVRVQKPIEFAYALLAPQVADPKSYFDRILASGEETQVDLVKHVPVHLTYMTAWVAPDGHVNYRRDVYGRDKRVFQALENAGVTLGAVSG